MSEFKLDERLNEDTHYLGETDLNLILIMNDCRWPWIILVPKIAEISEIFQLGEANQLQLNAQTNKTAQFLSSLMPCEKINVGALGNIVRQLHVHIVLRNVGDANWPLPVWGFGKPEPYRENALNDFNEKLLPLVSKLK